MNQTGIAPQFEGDDSRGDSFMVLPARNGPRIPIPQESLHGKNAHILRRVAQFLDDVAKRPSMLQSRPVTFDAQRIFRLVHKNKRCDIRFPACRFQRPRNHASLTAAPAFTALAKRDDPLQFPLFRNFNNMGDALIRVPRKGDAGTPVIHHPLVVFMERGENH